MSASVLPVSFIFDAACWASSFKLPVVCETRSVICFTYWLSCSFSGRYPRSSAARSARRRRISSPFTGAISRPIPIPTNMPLTKGLMCKFPFFSGQRVVSPFKREKYPRFSCILYGSSLLIRFTLDVSFTYGEGRQHLHKGRIGRIGTHRRNLLRQFCQPGRRESLLR